MPRQFCDAASPRARTSSTSSTHVDEKQHDLHRATDDDELDVDDHLHGRADDQLEQRHDDVDGDVALDHQHDDPGGAGNAYGFNENVGTNVADASGRGNTGTVNQIAWTPDGRIGSALVFNGITSWVTSPTRPPST